jgi:hypothetical protein
MALRAKVATRTRVTAKQIDKHRASSKVDNSPSWDGCDMWEVDEFSSNFYKALNYYNLKYSGKDLKPIVIKWLTNIGAESTDIAKFKKTKDWRCSVTMGAIASSLIKGMTPQRDDFNNGKDCSEWLLKMVNQAIQDGKNDLLLVDEVSTDTQQPVTPITKAVSKPVVSIQERVKDIALNMVVDIDELIEDYWVSGDEQLFSAFKVLNYLKGKQVKPAHARIITDFYTSPLTELLELASSNADPQLREGYNTRSKKQIRGLITFYQEIMSACKILTEEAKVVRKPTVRKTISKVVPKDKIVASLKYKKIDEFLKLVSINPVDIIGAKELWAYDTNTRKLFKYVTSDNSTLSVKGTSIIGFDETRSIGKTLRQPVVQIAAFKAANKVALRKFLDDVTTVDIRATGRMNDNIILLKTG